MPHPAGSARRSDRSRLRTDRQPNEQVKGIGAAELVSQLIPITAQISLGTGLTRCRQKMRLNTAVTQGVNGRLHIAPDRGTRDDQYTRHHCCMLPPKPESTTDRCEPTQLGSHPVRREHNSCQVPEFVDG